VAPLSIGEEAGALSFYWEFGGRGRGCIDSRLGMRRSGRLHTRGPWAAAAEILERVTQEVIRQKAPTCWADIDDEGGYIDIRENAPPSGRATGCRDTG